MDTTRSSGHEQVEDPTKINRPGIYKLILISETWVCTFNFIFFNVLISTNLLNLFVIRIQRKKSNTRVEHLKCTRE